MVVGGGGGTVSLSPLPQPLNSSDSSSLWGDDGGDPKTPIIRKRILSQALCAGNSQTPSPAGVKTPLA